MIHSIILGIVQGLTEFLPISSSAHLALLEHMFGIKEKLGITVFLHLGSVIAILLIMWRDIKEILLKDRRLIGLLILGSIPAGFTGILLESKIEQAFNSLNFIGISLVITGIMLWLTRLSKTKRQRVSIIDSLLIGIAQAIAIIPGISRSGFTIGTGIHLGVDRTVATKFSLLLGCIAIFGATLFELKDLRGIHSGNMIVGFIVSFIVSYLAIKILFKVVKNRSFAFFAIYCWALGFLVLLVR